AVPEPQVKVVEKIVEVERIVEVEKLVYVNADGTPVDNRVAKNTVAQTDSIDAATSIERGISQFIDHQQQLLHVHEQYMQGPKDYAKTFDAVLSSQDAGQLPESLDRTLAMYHEFQSETLRVHEQYLNNQTENMAAMLSGQQSEALKSQTNIKAPAESLLQDNTDNKAAQAASSAMTPAPLVTQTNATDIASHSASGSSTMPMQTVASAAAISPVAELSATLPENIATNDLAASLDKIQTVMMAVVADKTGYPTQMLELDMDMEADLGIDSIKRVEILGSVQESISDLPELNPEDLAELRTLGEIVDYMSAKAKIACQNNGIDPAAKKADLHLVATTSLASSENEQTQSALTKIQAVMMAVVAEKTGYPTQMLELEMDMEADLGIDSIKRVEILGAVQESISNLPELNPEDLAELRTLGEIVSYLQANLTTETLAQDGAATNAIQAADSKTTDSKAIGSESASKIDLENIQSVMMAVVAEKTGYPTQMLELEMDMEADLGIDSIKRVEILGA
ncbi:MAG: peptide-binding protein, partial [Gammaproteobacteria bacterium]|nr:peptide-binding protein [Gammaproteobacteria bacterium]